MSDKNPILTVAYCLETNRFEPAQTAHLHQRDTFYCTKCYILVTPVCSCKKNYFFRALSALHEENCRYRKEPTESTGQGTAKTGAAVQQPFLIPNLLGKITRVPRIGRPDPAELATLIAAASKLPILVPGTLENVVDAWCFMSTKEQKKEFLTINGINRSYFESFDFIGNKEKDINDFDWDNKIIYGGAKISKGSAQGYYFVDCYRKFLLQENYFPVKIILNPEFTSNNQKTYISEIENKDVTVFLHGCRPVFDPKRQRLIINLPKDLRYGGLCIRAK